MELVIILVILLFSAVIHEVCHGVMAYRLGDDTAKMAGRLTLNPIPHLDPFASILLPLFLVWVGSPFIFGAAKPVPVDFLRLRDPRKGMALVSLAGPGANFILALIFTLPIRLGLHNVVDPQHDLFVTAVVLNLGLGIFNLLPLPPLDGFKVFASLLSSNLVTIYRFLSFERYGFILIILFLYSGLIHRILVPLLSLVSNLFLGFSIF